MQITPLTHPLVANHPLNPLHTHTTPSTHLQWQITPSVNAGTILPLAFNSPFTHPRSVTNTSPHLNSTRQKFLISTPLNSNYFVESEASTGIEKKKKKEIHYWVQAFSFDFSETLPQPRSGHTVVVIEKSKVVVFGGLVDKKFLSDIIVYDIENKLWFKPECTRSGSNGQIGPSPQAFHVAIAIDCHMFIFGGRFCNRRLGDFWVLDTGGLSISTSISAKNATLDAKEGWVNGLLKANGRMVLALTEGVICHCRCVEGVVCV